MIIQPKPTIYKGVTYRSRLEARWAMLLDNHSLVRSWKYEPCTLRNAVGWEYTPDFLIEGHRPILPLCPHFQQVLLEVKPNAPSVEYERSLLSFIPANPLFIVYGNFYDIPFHTAHVSRRPSCPLNDELNEFLFCTDEEAVQLALTHRFDISSTPRRKR